MSAPIKRSLSSEGGATKRDWKMRLSLRIRSGHSVDALRGRRCASLRSSGGPQRVIGDSGRSTPAVIGVSPSPAGTPAPKKSNWEVIEHFSSNRNRRSPTTVENVLYIENPQENLTNSTITPATVLPQNVYLPFETNNPQVQETISIDIDNITENQKQMLEHQRQILDSQKQMLENQKQLIESNTVVLGQTQTLIKVQNNVLQKLSGLSVQLEGAVFQITKMRDTDKVQYLKDSNNLDNSPFHIKAIDSSKELDALEVQLTDNNYRNQLKHTYSIVCSKGGKGVDCAYALVDIMFTRKFICQCSWSGGSRGDNLKVPLKGYKQVLSFFWDIIHFWDETFTLKDNENFFKTILKNAHKRKLAKCERASTSRKRSKPCQINRKKTSTNENEINYGENTSQERRTEIDKNENQTGKDESQNTEVEIENQIDNENKEHYEEPESEYAEKERNQMGNANNEKIIKKGDEEDEPENVTAD